ESRLHGPPMHGIWGRGNEGSCSIVLSGGYEDDIDNLDYILYTGQGGQDSPGGKQVSDQEFTRGNRGLQLSCEYKLPVRVIRGHQVDNGPEKGYRYDGIYYVTSYERVKGKSGYYICRFHLESELYISDLEKKLDENLPENYQVSERIETTINRINRNIKLREKIKEIYQYRCQICNVYLKKPHGAIAIGAHIKGLGQPHNGPDILSNMLCLCPNHHDQFDALSFYINADDFIIVGLEDFEGEKITIDKKHKIKSEYLKYHMSQFIKKNN
ncbi:HNH endonuclease, partial [Gammaproteobacteria bacterium]|nr:HNH endonuclease [Gammaproteobacteria bacterium]